MTALVVVGEAAVVDKVVVAITVVVVGGAVVVVASASAVVVVTSPFQVTPSTVADIQVTLKVPFQMMVALRSTSVTKAP